MPDLYLLFSHQLTENQKQSAKTDLQVNQLHYLPADLQVIWSQVPPDLPSIRGQIEPIKNWLSKNVKAGDYLLIQGDFGATYKMVNWAFAHGCRPIYATTKRQTVEKRENDRVISEKVFQHVCFRLYEQ